MIPITVFENREVALFGLGASGIASARALIEGGARVAAFDDKEEALRAAGAAGIPIQDLRYADWSRFAALVLAPGVPLTHPEPHWTVKLARAAGIEIIGDIELFFRERRRRAPLSPVVAITGTNGKSTTTALTAHLLRHAGRLTDVGGNIGAPVLTLGAITPERHFVLECSSYQIDLSPTIEPSVGVHLNLSPDHLDRHGDFASYGAVKERLLAGVPGGGTLIVGVDDNASAAMADRVERKGASVLRISVRRPLAAGLYLEGTRLMRVENGASRPIANLAGIDSLRGAHNAQNAAASLAAVTALGVPEDVAAAGLATFPGLDHRMQLVGTLGGVKFVNDSKATNADAAERALLAFDGIHWIVGGRAKAGGIEPLRPLFNRVRHAYLIGEAAESFAATLGNAVPVTFCGTLDRAVEAAALNAARAADREPAVLLSPACASFDQFRDFEDRGNAFKRLVAALPGIRLPHGATP